MMPSRASAQLHGIGGNMGVSGTNCSGQCVAGFARAGDTVFITIQAVYTDSSGLAGGGDRSVVTNLSVAAASGCLNFNSGNLLTLNALPAVPAGNIIGGTFPALSFPDYPSYIPVHVTNANCGPVSYAVQIPGNCAGQITFTGNIQAYDTNNTANQNIGGPLAAQPSADLFVLQDCLQVAKFCTNGVGETGQITWRGFVTNCGNATLTDVVVTNFFNGTSERVFGPVTLTNGEWATFTGAYTPINICVPSTDTLVATGIDLIGCPVTGQDDATCELVLTPCIDITKSCDAVAQAGGVVNFSGVVTNCGNVTLTNVVILDTVPGVQTNVLVLGPVTIAPNNSVPYSSSYPVPASFCGFLTNTVTVTANTVCGAPVGPDSASCRTEVPCPPRICVTKEIACAPASGGCDDTLVYGPEATGTAGPTNQTAFCYKIVVWNCGADTLTNVTVVDNLIAGVQAAFAADTTTLVPGQFVTNFFSQSYSVGDYTNVVTATGTGAASGIITNAVADAVAHVLPLSVACDITLSSSLSQPGTGCDVTLLDLGTNQPVQFTLVVTNTGAVDLNVTISGVPALVDCATETPVSVPGIVFLPVGGSTNIEGCTFIGCPGTNLVVTVQGVAVASTAVPCVYDANGNAVTTAPSTCTACVNCVAPVICRTTGGGDLNPTNVFEGTEPCISIPTSLYPPTSVLGQALVLVTHGGQLGAPYGVKDCGEVLGNPCIRGQWEHVRHYQGRGNPRDVVTAFHTVTPKGQFDSMNCACLPCCGDFEGVDQPNGNFYGTTNHFVLCNADDHRICGPQPRPAPANALIWSGLGQLQQADDTTGKKPAEWVVVRVYIEDRSEPGGQHPQGSIDPPDVYVFQAWRTGVLVTKKPDFSTVAAALRTAVAQDSCAFLDALSTGAIPIGSLPSHSVGGIGADFYDQGPLFVGNRQIHPATGATCTP